MTSSTPARPPGRPRSGINDVVFAATLSTVHELGYALATVERIAAAATDAQERPVDPIVIRSVQVTG